MGFIRDHFSFHRHSPVVRLILSLAVFAFAGGITLIILTVAGFLIFNIDPAVLADLDAAEDAREIMFLKYMLVSQELAFFLVPSVIILSLSETGGAGRVLRKPLYPAGSMILALLASLALLPLAAFLGELNSRIDLSSWLPGVAERIGARGESIDRVFGLIMGGPGFWNISLNLVIIAAIPAITEELFFRGVLQKQVQDLMGSGHAAVFIVALIFSALHFQFEGFMPRLFLGIVFGYLYLYSGSLWLPVAAHFMNNAASVIISMNQTGNVLTGEQAGSIAKDLAGVILPAALLLSVLLILRKIQAQS